MIKQIVKLDGSIEEFTPSKVNGWGIWAADKLKDRVQWSEVVLEAVRTSPEVVKSQDLQDRLIDVCVSKGDWAHNLMAGRLYAARYSKQLYGNSVPTIKELFTTLQLIGLMKPLNYSDEEYAEIETYIDHKRDHDMAQFQIKQIRKKYSLQNRKTKTEYETPQFTYMRMAMALAEDEVGETKLKDVKAYYDHFSFQRINAPTPNYVNLGTKHNGYASCCLYTVGDTLASLAIGDHIAYTMTGMSAGIGGFINTRSVGDEVRQGLIEHQGKLPYYQSLAKAVKANLQAGRGGACTTYYSCFDPQAVAIAQVQNPRATEDVRNRDIHFAMLTNRLFAKKVAKDEDVFMFTVYSAPDLMKLFFSGDQDGFEALYNKYENDPTFEKKYTSAKSLAILLTQQSHEVSTNYFAFIDEINRHTAFKEAIHSSNLCVEITEPTAPYESMVDLYSIEDHGKGEVAICSLAAIVPDNIKSDEEHESAAYYSLKMIDKCIHLSHYALPHIGFTAKQRLNAGVGIVGLATCLARKNLKYSSLEGKEEIHRIHERHSFFMISASLKLGQELGNAPWMHKTKWPEGWLPIDTYKKNVDKIVNIPLQYDWEALRTAIIANKGIRNSCVIAHMPTESSAKASGRPKGVYPLTALSEKKSDSANVIDWCATDDDLIGSQYELAYDISSFDMIECYAVMQKFTDQSISADLFKDRVKFPVLSTKEMVEEFLHMVKYGMKTRYYQKSKVGKKTTETADVCASGACDV
jgi:ribonucleoside-diphosphate reductase alpha chain